MAGFTEAEIDDIFTYHPPVEDQPQDFDGFLRKPFKVAEAVEVIEQYLKGL